VGNPFLCINYGKVQFFAVRRVPELNIIACFVLSLMLLELRQLPSFPPLLGASVLYAWIFKEHGTPNSPTNPLIPSSNRTSNRNLIHFMSQSANVGQQEGLQRSHGVDDLPRSFNNCVKVTSTNCLNCSTFRPSRDRGGRCSVTHSTPSELVV
jgi:hypothetical protein